MGIPRLLTRLLHKAEKVVWPVIDDNREHDLQPSRPTSKKIAIIDGPALAYYIFHCHTQALAASGKLTFRIDYDSVSKRLLAFLVDLESRGFVIHHIFFDGALPDAKVSTRLARLQKSTQQAHAIRRLCDESTKSSSTLYGSCVAFLHEAWRNTNWPPPPFLVAAAVEKLLASPYKDITRYVPGEADHFCSKTARESAQGESTSVYIFTNDSDLLVHDLGMKTRVVMLNSIELSPNDMAGSSLHADTFFPATIAKSVGLDSMLKVAYLMSEDKFISFEDAASRVRNKSSPYSYAYDKFLAEVHGGTVKYYPFGSEQQSMLSKMDSRISEVIYQIFSPTTKRPQMYLPHLTDDVQRSSAWHCGITLRRLAYSILVNTDSPVTSISEHDRRGDQVLPLEVDLHKDDLEGSLQEYIEWLGQQTHPGASDWRLIGMIIVINEREIQGKPAPTSIDATVVLHGHPIKTWSQIHLTAQLDAAMYSLRILKLSLEFTLARHHDKQVHDNRKALLMQLYEMLSDLPPLLELFNPSPIAGGSHSTARLRHLLEAAAPVPRTKRKKVSKRVPKFEKASKQTLQSNMYALLAD